MDNPKIYVAFRFHVNGSPFLLGDDPDKERLEKTIRTIRHIINTLDSFNGKGINACGTWSSDICFSLLSVIPEHYPDILKSWKRRVSEGRDEFQISSYNNGLISAHSAREFEDVIQRSISNREKAGIKDIFGSVPSMVRPQEMMFTPIHLKAYTRLGITSISLYNSALPYNAFSNFVPSLTLVQRYNPLTLKCQGIDETMTLLPAYNSGDLVDNISLVKWVRKIRNEQLALSEPKDLMLLLDMNADDGFWIGKDYPLISRVFSTLQGLGGLINSLRELDYVEYSTPCKYLKNHDPVATIEIMQDTANGSFDGLGSWSEKWSNQRLWTGIERSRILELQSRRLLELIEQKKIEKEVELLLEESYEERLQCLATAHFGLSSPIMNPAQLDASAKLVRSSVVKAAKAFGIVDIFFNETRGSDSFTLINYTRGVDTSTFQYPGVDSKGLIKLRLTNLDETRFQTLSILDESDQPVPFCLVSGSNEFNEKHQQLYFKDELAAKEEKTYKLVFDQNQGPEPHASPPRNTSLDMMENAEITCRFDEESNVKGLIYKGKEYLSDNSFHTAVTYAKHRTDAEAWKEVDFNMSGTGEIQIRRMRTELLLKAAGGKKVEVKRQFRLADDLPYLYVDMSIKYPITSFQKYGSEKAESLGQAWDGNWIEVMPCELIPSFVSTKGNHFHIWKHNFFGHVSHYDVNYADFSRNNELDAFNNQITNGWIAVSDGSRGILIAQTCEATSSLAFCPMRTVKFGSETIINLNPFGSYYGRQLKYQTATTGFGKLGTYMTANHLDPLAPSYNGKKQSFSLLIAPYEGDEPPQEIQNDAMAFAYPYLMLTKSDLIKDPEYKNWKYLP